MSERYSSHCGSPFGSPSSPQERRHLPKNYSEEFDPRQYECQTTVDLESYARNLHNMLMGFLKQNPFPAALFDKLEKRLDGITSILQNRYRANAITTDIGTAEHRLRTLSKRIAPALPETTTPQTMQDEPDHPPKKRKFESPCIKDVRIALKEQRERRQNENFSFNEEEEEQ